MFPKKYYIPSPKMPYFPILKSTNYLKSQIRMYSSDLSHTTEDGKANMVNIGDKEVTKRIAKAKGSVKVGTKIIQLITENNMKKGNVLTVAQIAGIMAAKRTSEIIPLCHNIPLTSVNISLGLTETEILISAEAHCIGKTGVEMEALTAVSVAALAIYDMCKSVSHNITIEHISLVEKDGGKSKYVKFNTTPIDTSEPFYPTYV